MRIKKILLGTLIAAIVISSASSFASDEATITIKGNIIPTACSLMLNNGDIDFGNDIKLEADSSTPTTLSKKTIKYTIKCPSEKAIKYTFKDNQSNKEGAADGKFGLGKTSTLGEIGYYKLTNTIGSNVGDSNNGFLISSTDDGGTWTMSTNPYIAGQTYSTAHSGDSPTPKGYRTLTGDIAVETVINPSSKLGGSDKIELNGSSTMTISYI
ncbi:DUF1120 domain-containing protein [Glaciimonas sp. GG7]